MAQFVTIPEANQLLLDGTLALSEIESAGVRVDKTYLDAALKRTAERIHELEDELRADPIYKLWRRRYGEGTKLGAPAQLAGVVYGDLGYKPRKQTAGGERGSADESAFEGIDLPFVRKYFECQKVRKGRGTYLTGIEREMVLHDDGCYYVHPSYNLNTVTTFRSSAQDPNFQNQPNRNPMMAEMIRRTYIPRPGHQLVEVDYEQQEVKVSACYNKDRNLIRYINDPTSDMHRDTARKLFMLKEKQVTKPIRFAAKSSMVFAQFYGDYYPHCARGLWEGIHGLNLPDGTPLYDHLAAHGINEMGDCDGEDGPRDGTFEKHVQSVERWLWEKQFPEFAQWKKDWYAAYQRNGGMMMLTGFAINGYRTRNEIINAGTQGSAFHCLLLALIRIVRRLKKYKMKSRVIGQIHDSCLGDVHPRERDDYIEIVREAMVDYVMRKWDWLIVPLSTEVEACEPDASWFDKKVLTEQDGTRKLKA